MTPKVSVVIPVYNGARTLARAVDSILGQSLRDIELIVVDDGSTDATPDILAAIPDSRLRVIRQANGGRSLARNAALRAARAEYVAMLDADDVAYPERLARQAAFLDAHPDVALCGTWAHRIEPDGSQHEWRQPLEAGEIRRTMLRSDCFIHSTVMARKRVLQECGGYDESLDFSEDYDLYLRIAGRCATANLPEILCAYRAPVGARYRLKEQWHKTRVKWRAIRDYGYPRRQLLCLATPLLTTFIPARLRLALKRAWISRS
jgi:glycosyltransferase involved in cell wall biosynthesis